MARTAAPLEGAPISVVTVVPGVLSYHVNKVQSPESADAFAYRVTPWLSGKFQKSLAYDIPEIVANALVSAITPGSL